jgi:hypothetical protein
MQPDYNPAIEDAIYILKTPTEQLKVKADEWSPVFSFLGQESAPAGDAVIDVALTVLGPEAAARLIPERAVFFTDEIGLLARHGDDIIDPVVPNIAFRGAQGQLPGWRQPGHRVRARAAALADQLGLDAQGRIFTSDFSNVRAIRLGDRQLAPYELLALSENFGREYALLHHEFQGWLLQAGKRRGVDHVIGRHITRSIHTHPGTIAAVSDPDLLTQLRHWNLGGGGALEIVHRGANGRAVTVQYGRAEVAGEAFYRAAFPLP